MNEWPVLSVRQPWAWLILHGGKTIENRTRRTKYRGRFWVHASLGCTSTEMSDAYFFCRQRGLNQPPGLIKVYGPFGGIIGSVELVDCVTEHESPWFTGPFGYVLRNPEPCAFRPLKGRLGFFKEHA